MLKKIREKKVGLELTDQGLNEIGQFAEETHNANIMLIVQVLREVREVKALLDKHQDTCNCIGKSTAPEKEQGQSASLDLTGINEYLRKDLEERTSQIADSKTDKY